MNEQFSLLPEISRPRVADKSELGQFFTSYEIACFMRGLFSGSVIPAHLLDPGAGQGILAKSFSEKFPALQAATLIERDATLIPGLERLFAASSIKTSVLNDDFIKVGSAWVAAGKRPFSHVMMNPPYRKIASSSSERKHLRMAGIETVNLYSGFVALALALLKPHGELAAIIPRSFCNGPYYLGFRRFMLERCALRSIHLFKSRTSLFNSDKVLQENVIIHLERDGVQKDVRLSFSEDQTFADLETTLQPFNSVVAPEDGQHFIKISPVASARPLKKSNESLRALPLSVSTGPVVDFRLKEYLRKNPEQGDAPLLYPAHFNKGFRWPRPEFRKFNSISVCGATLRFLFPSGWYVVVRRLSSKEEKRRIVANVVNPNDFPAGDFIAFENHFNVFHNARKGLEENAAFGLAAWLNSGRTDQAFRAFSGHTQVNAADLRSLLYPPIDELAALGEEARSIPKERLDEWLTGKLG